MVLKMCFFAHSDGWIRAEIYLQTTERSEKRLNCPRLLKIHAPSIECQSSVKPETFQQSRANLGHDQPAQPTEQRGAGRRRPISASLYPNPGPPMVPKSTCPRILE